MMIRGNWMLVNSHTIPDNFTRLFLKFDNYKVGEMIEVSRDSLTVVTMEDKDITLIHVPSVRPFANLIKYMPTVARGSGLGTLLAPDVSQFQNHELGVCTFAMGTLPYARDAPCLISKPRHPTLDGMCGLPLILECGSNIMFGGIHGAFSSNGDALALLLTQDMFKVCEGSPQAQVPDLGDCPTSDNIHFKAVFNHEMSGSATILGGLPGHRATPKTRVTDSIIKETYLKLGGKDPNFGPPVMKGWRPWRIAALDLTRPVRGFKVSDLDRAVADYLVGLQHLDLSKLEKYNQHVALNGAPGVAYVDGINRQTSSGMPFRVVKTKLLVPLDSTEEYPDAVALTPKVQTRIDRIWDLYSQNKLFHPVFTASLKDEPVSAKKRAIGKTRVFCGAPFDWTIVVRQLFMSHIRLIQHNKIEFECAVGAVAQSIEWSSFYDYITQFGDDCIVAGDYKSYDKRMSPQVILAAFEILISLAAKSGNFDSEDIRAMRCVAFDTAYPMVNYNGTLVQFWGSNPSGHPLTVHINSIVNSLYMRLAYFGLGNTTPFREAVSLLTYGDDNIMGVNKELAPNFDHTLVAKYFSDFDIVYTMADKEAESVPFIPIGEASFLKRKWVWGDEIIAHYAPLEEESIHKMLTCIVSSSSVTVEEQISDILRAANLEYWFYGKTKFEEKRALFCKIIEIHGLEAFFAKDPLASWQDIHNLWLRATQRYKMVQGL
jgi:hypothetical protein